jgi:hypothetical protein
MVQPTNQRYTRLIIYGGKGSNHLYAYCSFFTLPLPPGMYFHFRFIEGLSINGVCDMLQRNPETFKLLFCLPPQPLTSDAIRRFFKPVMSETGNARAAEVAILAFWNDFILDMEDELNNVSKEVDNERAV